MYLLCCQHLQIICNKIICTYSLGQKKVSFVGMHVLYWQHAMPARRAPGGGLGGGRGPGGGPLGGRGGGTLGGLGGGLPGGGFGPGGGCGPFTPFSWVQTLHTSDRQSQPPANSMSSPSHFRVWWEPLTEMRSEMRQKADNTCGLFKLIFTSPLDSLTLIPWPLATLGPDPEFPWTPRSSQHTNYRPTVGHGIWWKMLWKRTEFCR